MRVKEAKVGLRCGRAVGGEGGRWLVHWLDNFLATPRRKFYQTFMPVVLLHGKQETSTEVWKKVFVHTKSRKRG